MLELYRSPLRIYLVFAMLCVAGAFAASTLPISLFPDSQKPVMRACIPSTMAPEAFLRSYGMRIEERLRAIGGPGIRVERVAAYYEPGESCFDVEFRWGDSPERALLETRGALNALTSGLPAESRERASAFAKNENSGFLAIVFSSARRTPEELFKLLDPLLAPKLAQIRDAPEAALWNPKQKQLIVELRPDAMSSFGFFPSAVADALEKGLESYGAGRLIVGDESLPVSFPPPSQGIEGFKRMPIAPVKGRTVTLGDVAHLDFAVPLGGARSFKADGAPSVVMFASTRPGGNVAQMANQGLQAAKEAAERLPKDVWMKALVDPSEFIESAIANVAKEAGLAALLAVFALWLFVGNARNVATAAIEIPISVIMAFILMRFSGVNINMVSLAGLALSAGMNVDASVVVMENVFRRLRGARETEGVLSFDRKSRIVADAVSEVMFPVLASAVGSIVVFVPLAFTSELTYALLGDLAKAVVYSHGCSIFVALVLVPTIRLHIMRADRSGSSERESPSPIEGALKRLESWYAGRLEWFLSSLGAQTFVGGALLAALAFLAVVVAPRLPREVVGRPSADWIIVGVNARGNSENGQMEDRIDEVERVMRSALGGRLVSVFSQVDSPSDGWAMARLRDKDEMPLALNELERRLITTPLISYNVDSWNPAELTLPDPPEFKASIRGSSPEGLTAAARILARRISELRVFSRVETEPESGKGEGLFVRPKLDLLPQLGAAGTYLSTADLADLARTAIGPRYVARFEHEGRTAEAYMRFPDDFVKTPEELAAMPVGVGGRIVPLSAIASVERGVSSPSIMRENGREVAYVTGKLAKADKGRGEAARAAALEAVEQAEQEIARDAEENAYAPGSITLEEPDRELNLALRQLTGAVGASVLLLFATMMFQFGNAAMALIVLATAPLGLVGAIASLWVFGSTVSLNSLLGVILLNGLSVANGILLLDFMNRAIAGGLSPLEAAIETGRHRLRPILMTALATLLGMLPIASGMGEGGKVLQPLGLSVAGGLAFSTAATLFVVPALAVHYWQNRARRAPAPAAIASRPIN